ncbi:MAG TPA: isocitrate/isopropylmalate dehydrogenase family protein [Candidatus Acidoferrales bacterium]|nr:isocitrate/isopropylmalate dehydrogenase family protein [Candidatus Acidoferrales bacterium]
MAHRVTLMAGDGIGPEVTAAAVEVVEASGAKIVWDEVEVGASAVKKYGTPLPANVFTSLGKTKVGLKGPIETPIARGFPSANVALRKELNLYANLRPVKSLPGVKSRYENVDLVVVRENTESLYAGVEHTVAPGVVESVKIITWEACTRIAKFAFDYAARMGRKRVTAVHKANIMKLSDGLFLEAARKVAKRYPKIRYDEVIVDALCMKLVVNPNQFDLLLCENLYGDIVSDLCSGFVGGLGMAPGANIGLRGAVFEPVHGSAPDIAGKGIANPAAMILAAELMLQHLGERKAAAKIHRALLAALRTKKALTPDLGGKGTTRSFTDAILAHLS